MSIPQVGQGAVAIVPTFRGFRSAVSKESDGAAKEGARGFRSLWSKEGTSSGRSVGKGFKQAFDVESSGFTAKSTKELEQAVSRASRALSTARLKQLDQAGKVRVAEAQLAEAQEKHAAGSSQVLRATERLAAETRKLETANDQTAQATTELRDAQGRLGEAAERAGDSLGNAGRSGARRFTSGFSDVFAGSFLGTTIANFASSIVSRIGAAVGQGIRSAIEFGIGTVDIASDLNESVNAVQVSYGDISDEILKIGETSARTFGLSRRQLNQYAVQFSAFSKTIAGDGGDVTSTFQSILGRATDFASVMNLEVAEALGLFQSGLAGETEPLRRYGIDLSAATVETYAYANGIGVAGEELTEAQKQQARYGALLQQTAAVQGDFANTSDELANKNRINAATWDDLQARIGSAFLPVASTLASILADDVLPVIESLVDEYGPGLGTAFEEALPSIRELAADVLPLLPDLLASLADSLPTIIQLVTAIAPAMIAATQANNGFYTGIGALFNLLSGSTSVAEFIAEVLDIPGPFGDALRAVGQFASGAGAQFGVAIFHVRQFGAGVQATVSQVVSWFQALPGQITGFFSNAGQWLYNSGRAVIQGFIDGINTMFRPVGDAVSGIMSWVQGFFPNSPAKRGPFSGSGWTRLSRSGSAVMEEWTTGFARPDLTGALSPALFATASAAAPSGGAGAGMPRELVIVDADRQLIGRMRVEADGVARSQSRDRRTSLQLGTRR